ncbi:SDR family NAD(P)-dependent oxidoreductase [Phytohabitans rumicis]|uniref:SDR family NAD(P)-dependent oxidoreductase n=1 Tax=Phytohabitans rumicis TaxID=1076125 RepID=UPI0031E65D3D
MFTNKTALVTGGGSGIGAAVARGLAGRGAAAVVVADVNAGAARAVASALPAARAATVDVADAAGVEEAIAQVVRDHGRLDVVVHAAGVDDPAAKQAIADALTAGEPPDITARLDDASWRRVRSVNLDGTFHVLRAALRAMLPARSGAIVVVGSSASFDAPIGYAHYAAAKAGVHALSQSVAKEAIAFGIRVNVVAPGPTDTGMAARTPEALRHSMSGGRVRPYATPEEIADVALFLAGDGAANLVGAVLLANGGRFTA